MAGRIYISPRIFGGLPPSYAVQPVYTSSHHAHPGDSRFPSAGDLRIIQNQ